MATQRYISTSFWDDRWIRSLNPADRYLYLYLMTNPLTSIAGVYEITIDRMAFDTGYDERALRLMLGKFREAGKAYHLNDEWIILPSWPKHQKINKRSNIKSGIDSILLSLPDEVYNSLNALNYQYEYLKDLDSIRPFKPLQAPSRTSNYLDPDLDSDLDTDTDLDVSGDEEEVSQSSLKDFEKWLRKYARESSSIKYPDRFVKAILKVGPSHESWPELQDLFRDERAKQEHRRKNKIPNTCPKCSGQLVVSDGRAKCIGDCKSQYDYVDGVLSPVDPVDTTAPDNGFDGFDEAFSFQ